MYHRLHLQALVIKRAIPGNRARFLVRGRRRASRQTITSSARAYILEQGVVGLDFLLVGGSLAVFEIDGLDCVDPHVELVVRAERLESCRAFQLVYQVVFQFVFCGLETG